MEQQIQDILVFLLVIVSVYATLKAITKFEGETQYKDDGVNEESEGVSSQKPVPIPENNLIIRENHGMPLIKSTPNALKKVKVRTSPAGQRDDRTIPVNRANEKSETSAIQAKPRQMDIPKQMGNRIEEMFSPKDASNHARNEIAQLIDRSGNASLKFGLTNGVTVQEVYESHGVVYAHVNGSGDVYVGKSVDPVNRWKTHLDAACNPFDGQFGASFQQALRDTHGKGWAHFILATAHNEDELHYKESSAINHYATLNSISGKVDQDYSWEQSIIAREYLAFSSKVDRSDYKAFADRDRQWQHCKVVYSKNKKRIQSTDYGPFPPGLFVMCSKEARGLYEIGDLVEVFCKLSEKGNQLIAKKGPDNIRAAD
ncbi:hypothetical protein [Endozoicomonas sp. GU-1]|uniref:hypothetical protein n=1 Tax=Endozoicomonas sp. GU-1 TaxID=3009078 RepID=UPI0022B5C617|nr:hypothetical protein [Endozoicomonas sp. GU-1]WBA81438.1 hypothetical protein O2T12_24700 [Endozoicomonas sp. GU-1]WBA84385.1 hypothetical protein O3276_13860 [Endozoicomonas sp. GU-1]